MLDSIYTFYFSPTGGTEKISRLMASYLSKKTNFYDLSSKNKADYLVENLGEKDIALVALPVYGGRIPELAKKRLKLIKSTGTQVISLVTYGNREYDDALLELNDFMKEQGFKILASLACISPHSLAPDFGKGRPDAQDLSKMEEFSKKILAKLKSDQYSPVKVKGNHPYKDYQKAPLSPLSTEDCVLCGDCEELCPSGAISINGSLETDLALCDLCARCVKICPTGARIFPEAFSAKINKMLKEKASTKKEIEFFI